MDMPNREDQVKALANETRIEVLRLLDDPAAHFSKQESADPVEVGVCVQLLAEHFGVSQPTMSRHIELLKRAGFIVANRLQKWTYCSRDDAVLADYARWLKSSLNIKTI
ncbi:MAG: helix-turn-helix domain-containing protein [Kiloniellales bacterium]|nr:helix-turn-helix domain-containing protein [Kiloniellales bacterium]